MNCRLSSRAFTERSPERGRRRLSPPLPLSLLFRITKTIVLLVVIATASAQGRGRSNVDPSMKGRPPPKAMGVNADAKIKGKWEGKKKWAETWKIKSPSEKSKWRDEVTAKKREQTRKRRESREWFKNKSPSEKEKWKAERKASHNILFPSIFSVQWFLFFLTHSYFRILFVCCLRNYTYAHTNL